MSTATNLGSTPDVGLAFKCPACTAIDIFRNSLWAGSATVRDGRIVDCYAAQLGRDGDETEEIYDAIEHAITKGENYLIWSRDGRLSFSWRSGAADF